MKDQLIPIIFGFINTGRDVAKSKVKLRGGINIIIIIALLEFGISILQEIQKNFKKKYSFESECKLQILQSSHTI